MTNESAKSETTPAPPQPLTVSEEMRVLHRLARTLEDMTAEDQARTVSWLVSKFGGEEPRAVYHGVNAGAGDGAGGVG